MSRYPWFFALMPLIACDVSPGEEGPAALEVVVVASCADEACTELVAEALTATGQPTRWSWVLPDGSRAEGQTTKVAMVDTIGLVEVTAEADDGGTHQAFGALASLNVSVAAQGDVTDPGGVVFVPLGTCANVPVVNVGGCISGGNDPLTLHISAVANDTVTFSSADAMAGAPGAYTSTQADPHAVWRLGSTTIVDGQAPSTSSGIYYTGLYPAPSPSASHFTAYFEGVVGGTSQVMVSHGSPGGKVFSTHQLSVTCDTEGRITQVLRVPVDKESLDFDGDGYPASEDCDETDARVYPGSGC